MSEAEIIAQLGVTPWKVERARAFHAERHPGALCGCGRPLRHSGACPARMPPPHNRISPETLARIATWTEQGYAAAPIARRLGVSKACVDRNRQPVLRALRARGAPCPCGRPIGHKAQCEERRRDPPADQPIGAVAEKLLATIRRHVPRTLDPALRDDIASELYLAILQGELAEAEIAAAAPRFISRAFAAWADKWRSRSLDAALGDDEDGRTLGDTFGDGTGAGLVEDLEIGGEW